MSQNFEKDGSTIWKYNGVELELDLNDVDTMEKYEEVFDLMAEEAKQEPKDGPQSAIVRAYCTTVRHVFDRLFGEGTSVRLVGEKDNALVLTECYEDFLAFVTAQKNKTLDAQNRIRNRYSPNRAQRRAEGKKEAQLIGFNIMIDPLPCAVSVCGREFPISSDFRTGILFEQMIQDPSLSDEEKVLTGLQLYYGDEIPDDVETAITALLSFYSCKDLDDEEEKRKVARSKASRSNKRIYDFDVDAPYIYAAFLSQYGVDLQDVEYLHWWKFMAMFLGLNEENEICKIMGYRAVDLAQIKSKAEKKRLAVLQEKYRLPDNRTAEEKAAMVGAMFGGMTNVRK